MQVFLMYFSPALFQMHEYCSIVNVLQCPTVGNPRVLQYCKWHAGVALLQMHEYCSIANGTQVLHCCKCTSGAVLQMARRCCTVANARVVEYCKWHAGVANARVLQYCKWHACVANALVLKYCKLHAGVALLQMHEYCSIAHMASRCCKKETDRHYIYAGCQICQLPFHYQ